MGSTVFVNAWLGAGNLGDELLFERLRARLDEHDIDHITAVSLDPADTAQRHPGVSTVTPRQLLASARAVKRADVVIVGPGGILQDDTSPWSLPYQLHRSVLARVLGTTVIGYGLGAGPVRRRSSGWLLRRGLGHAAAVIVRDEPSAELLADFGVEATPTADLVIATPPPPVDVDDVLVVALRPHRPGGAAVPVRWQTDELDPGRLEALASALDTIAETHDLRVRFVAFEPHRDHPLHEAVAALMASDTTCVVPETDTLIAEVARARLVVATRFHAGIAALVSARPAVLIGYAPKVRSLAERTGDIYPLLADETEALTGLPTAADAALAVDPARIRSAVDELRRIESTNADLLARALGRD